MAAVMIASTPEPVAVTRSSRARTQTGVLHQVQNAIPTRGMISMSRARFTYTRSRRHASNVSQRTCASASEGFWGSGDSEAEDWSGVSMGQGKHKLHPMYVKGTIRAGQAVEHDGSIIVYGDVNQDALVSATGDVLIWGRLRGDAAAGINGGPDAVIMALQMEPTVLEIAGVKAYGPKGAADAKVPEKAVIRFDSQSNEPRISIVQAFEWSMTKEVLSPSMEEQGSTQTNRNWAAIKAAYFTGAYILLVGFLLMFFPSTIFSVFFDVRYISSGWIRVFGVVSSVFGMYYLGTAYGDSVGADARAFYVSTVVGRVFLFFAFCALVATRRFAEPMLLLLGIVNFLGALVMYTALRKPTSKK